MHPSKASQADILIKQCLLDKTRMPWFPPWVIRSWHRDPSSLRVSHSQGWECQMVMTVGYHLRWNYSLWRLSGWLTGFPQLYPHRLYHTPISPHKPPHLGTGPPRSQERGSGSTAVGSHRVSFLLHQKLIENWSTLSQFHSALKNLFLNNINVLE